jgi:Transposase, Mutator family
MAIATGTGRRGPEWSNCASQAVRTAQRRGQTSTRVVGIFPNDPAITRLVRAILLEQNGEWAIQRAQYMTLETVAALGDDSVVGLPAMAI